MATTQYLHLNKPMGNDLVNPLTDTFPNWDLVDTAYHELDSRAIGRATEVVSQGVHAITLLDTDCKTFKFVATGNYSAGETFTVNGIQANAYTPSGSALVSNAFVTGSIVLGTLNEDGTAITFYVTGSAVADDSLKLGGELPSYYATQSDMSDAETDITNLKNQAGNTSIVGIGDGTLSGAVSSLNNDLTANNNKFEATYQNGIYGFMINNTFYEIGGGSMPILNYANPIKLLTGRDGDNSGSYTVPRDCYMTGILSAGGGSQAGAKVFKIDGTDVFSFYHDASESNLVLVPITKLKQGQVLTYSGWDSTQVHNLGLYDAL